MDVRTQDLMAQQGNIRVDPYAKPSADPLPPSMEKTLGKVNPNSHPVDIPQPSINPDANGDGELDAEELGHLQDAAANGDKESWDMLNALKLPLGVAAGAAALYGATRGGLSLVDAVSKNNGGIMGGRHMDGTTNIDPNAPKPMVPQGRLEGHNGQKLLPAPQNKLTDTTGSRFNQGTSVEQPKLIPDLNKKGREVDAAYAQHEAQNAELVRKAELEKSFGHSVGMRLRSAAKAARRIH